MKAMLMILFSMILVDNYVLSKFLGICSFLGLTRELKSAMGMSFAVTFVMLVATAVTWPIYMFVLAPNSIEYLHIVIFILVIASIVQVLEAVIKKIMPPLYLAMGIYLPLITTNCAILAVTIESIDAGYSFAQSMVNALGAGLGFMLAMFLFTGVRHKIEQGNPPKFLKGLPITLIAASIVSVSFFGFKGLLENLFA